MDSSFDKALDLLGPYEDEFVIAIGVSGGSDSLALVFLANEWAKRKNGKVVALTVDHGLRQESLAEAKEVSLLLKNHAIEHHIIPWAHGEVVSNVQEAAREARLLLLTNWCRENDILHLMLGQHAEDQAETALIKIFRGSGLNGLCGISTVSAFNNVRVLRPFLNFDKAQLNRELLKYSKWWVNDPSNNDGKYIRTVARRALKSEELCKLVNVEEDPSKRVHERLNLMSANMRRVQQTIENQVVKCMVEMVNIYPRGTILIDFNKMREVDDEIGLDILARCLITISRTHYKRPRLESLQRIWRAIKANEERKFTLWECVINLIVSKNIIEILPEKTQETEFKPIVPLAK